MNVKTVFFVGSFQTIRCDRGAVLVHQCYNYTATKFLLIIVVSSIAAFIYIFLCFYKNFTRCLNLPDWG